MLKYPFKILIKIRKKRASKNYSFLLITNLGCPRLNIKEKIYIYLTFPILECHRSWNQQHGNNRKRIENEMLRSEILIINQPIQTPF